MSLKTVMHPETKEIITIDSAKEPKRMSKYLHRITGLPFANPVVETETVVEESASSEVVEETIEEVVAVEEVEEEATDEEEVEMTLEEIHAKYTEVTGKDVPSRYKNDTEWLLAKINA